MGNKIAQPTPAANTEAKAAADLSLSAMELARDNFFSNVRYGNPTSDTLGYKLVSDKLDAQEFKLIVKTDDNVTSETISEGIKAVFAKDWTKVTELAADALVGFLGGATPKPADQAVNEVYGKSFLVWEHRNLSQYSVYIKKTNSKSVGLATQDSETTMMCCICKGLVDFAYVDPQTITAHVSESNPNMTDDEFQALMDSIEKSLAAAAKLARFKLQLTAEAAGHDGPNAVMTADVVDDAALENEEAKVIEDRIAQAKSLWRELRS